MRVNTLDDSVIRDIGHAFGYYDYGSETGLVAAFSEKEGASVYIQGYVRCMLKAGLLYTTGPEQEGFIAYKLPGEKIGANAAWPLLKAVFRSLSFKEIVRFVRCMGKGGQGLSDRLNKEKKPHVFVGMVAVREKYQGQGYMRKVMEMAYAEGDRLNVPVVLETDAISKRDKYMHLGMELAGTRDLGELGFIYDLIRYPGGLRS